MFGAIYINYAKQPQTWIEKLENRIKLIFAIPKLEQKEINLCGMLLCEYTLTLPWLHNKRCFCNAANIMYQKGIKRVAVQKDFPFTDVLQKSGIKLSDTQELYKMMYPSLLCKSAQACEIKLSEARVLVYAKSASRELYKFCENIAGLCRYITLIGPPIVKSLEEKLLNQFGIPSEPASSENGYMGDILVCFDELDDKVSAYSSHIDVKSTIMPCLSTNLMHVSSFLNINNASYDVRQQKVCQYADDHMNDALTAMLVSGGFVRAKDLNVSALRWNDINIG